MARIVVRRNRSKTGNKTKIVRIRSVNGQKPSNYVRGNSRRVVRVVRKRV